MITNLLTKISPFILYIKLALGAALIGVVSFAGFQIGVWKEESKNVAQINAIVAENNTLKLELTHKEYTIGLYAANTEIINAQKAENDKRIASLNKALAKKQKNVASIKASDCSSALQEIINANN